MIASFTGQYRFLSNFYLCDVWYRGRMWLSAEHAYQAAKTDDPAWHERIMKASTPGGAKRLGRQVPLVRNWERIRLAAMSHIVSLKFSQNRLLRDALQSTGDEELIEGNTWGDTYWGVCNGKGENWLGRILMLQRSAASYCG